MVTCKQIKNQRDQDLKPLSSLLALFHVDLLIALILGPHLPFSLTCMVDGLFHSWGSLFMDYCEGGSASQISLAKSSPIILAGR